MLKDSDREVDLNAYKNQFKEFYENDETFRDFCYFRTGEELCNVIEDSPYLDYFEEIYYGETRAVFILPYTDYVAKVNLNKNLDYNVIEESIYEKVSGSSYEKFFTEMVYGSPFGNEGECEFYLARRAETDKDCFIEEIFSEKTNDLLVLKGYSKEIAEEMTERIVDDYSDDQENFTYELFKLFYEEEEVNDLFEFIEEEDINDLHFGNVGFRNKFPILIDYAGYHGYNEN